MLSDIHTSFRRVLVQLRRRESQLRRTVPVTGTWWRLMAWVVAARAADVITTTAAVARHGAGFEVNPVVAGVYAVAPSLWIGAAAFTVFSAALIGVIAALTAWVEQYTVRGSHGFVIGAATIWTLAAFNNTVFLLVT